MLQIMSVPDEVYGRAFVYTTIYFGGIWSMILYNMTAGILRAYGDSKRPLYVLVCCAVINILGDLLLVGVLDMGVAGAALATVFSQIVSVVVIFSMLKKVLHVEKGEKALWWPHFCKEHMQQMLQMGFPLALQSMLFPIANTIVQAGVNTMGTDQIAAWGICDKLNMLIWLLSDSMGPALTTFTAQNLGAKNKERIRKGVRWYSYVCWSCHYGEYHSVRWRSFYDTLVCVRTGCSYFSTSGWCLCQDDGTVFPVLCYRRGSVGSLLWHGRYDQTDDHHP